MICKGSILYCDNRKSKYRGGIYKIVDVQTCLSPIGHIKTLDLEVLRYPVNHENDIKYFGFINNLIMDDGKIEYGFVEISKSEALARLL